MMIPDTPYRRELKLLCKSNSLLHFLIHVVLNHDMKKTERIAQDSLFRVWEHWCDISKLKSTYSPISFTRNLKTKFGVMREIAVPTFEFPNNRVIGVTIEHETAATKPIPTFRLSKEIVNEIFCTKLKYPKWDVQKDWTIKILVSY